MLHDSDCRIVRACNVRIQDIGSFGNYTYEYLFRLAVTLSVVVLEFLNESKIAAQCSYIWAER